MSDKYLIVGATGSIGSNLAEQLYSLGKEIHLVGRDEENIKTLSEKFNCKYSIVYNKKTTKNRRISCTKERIFWQFLFVTF